MKTAGIVPTPKRGSQSACSGGKYLTCTSQPVSAGSAIAHPASATATKNPMKGSRRAQRGLGPEVVIAARLVIERLGEQSVEVALA